MRLFFVTLLLCAASPVSAADVAPTKSDDTRVDATLSQAREVLERWERVLSEEEASPLLSSAEVCRLYLDAWATVDLDRAIELEPRHHCRASQNRLVERLAAARRWDDVRGIIDGDPEHFKISAPEFWARVACNGAQIGDPEMVDLAGRGVEIQAAADPSEPGLPPRPSERVAMARFYVAASRLHLIRQRNEAGPDLDSDGELSAAERQLRHDQRREFRAARDDLWRAAGGVVPRPLPFGFRLGGESTSVQAFAALESWEDVDPHSGLVVLERDNFVHDLIDAWRQERPTLPRARMGEFLPDLSRSVTSAWLVRQMILGRTDAAISCVWLAPGSDVDRARLLAIISRYLPPEDDALAASWRTAADAFLQSVDNVDDATVKALAELSLAYSAAGDTENAVRCIDRTFSAYSADAEAGQRWATRYETQKVLLQAVAALTTPYPRLAEILERFGDKKFRLHYRFEVDGLLRETDLTQIIPDSMVYRATQYVYHSQYHEYHDSGNWLAAIEEAARLAKLNSAWARSYRTLGEESVREIGLAATLEWCRNITDPEVRFAAEVAAVAESLLSRRKSLPEIDADDPHFVAPTIAWPDDC